MKPADSLILTTTFTRQLSHSTPWHSHQEGQLFVILQGLMIIQTKHTRWIMPSGRAGWLPPNLKHSAKSFGSIHGNILYFPSHLTAPLSKDPLVFTPNKLLEEIIKRVMTWENLKIHNAKKNVLLQILLNELEEVTQDPLSLTMPSDKRLEKIACAFIAEPALERTLDEWANVAHMTVRTFTRHFRAQTGMSFTKWCQLVRVQQALKYLSKGKTVTWIASTLGYDSVSAFIKVFSKFIGKTPLDFKNKTS